MDQPVDVPPGVFRVASNVVNVGPNAAELFDVRLVSQRPSDTRLMPNFTLVTPTLSVAVPLKVTSALGTVAPTVGTACSPLGRSVSSTGGVPVGGAVAPGMAKERTTTVEMLALWSLVLNWAM